MSLVRYCINLQDLANLISGVVGGLQPSEFSYELGWQRSKGFKIKSMTNGMLCEDIVINYDEYIITGLRVGCTSMNNNFDETNARNKDYFHFMVNGEKVFESVYMKDITMYKNFRVPFKVTKEMIEDGLDIKLCYYNGEIEKCDFTSDEDCESNIPVDVWFDIDFLAEPKLTEVTINYIDDNGSELLPSKTKYMSEGNMRIFSKDIDGYYVIDDYFKDICVIYDTPIVVDFEYIKT